MSILWYFILTNYLNRTDDFERQYYLLHCSKTCPKWVFWVYFSQCHPPLPLRHVPKCLEHSILPSKQIWNMKYRHRHYKQGLGKETGWFSKCYISQWNPSQIQANHCYLFISEHMKNQWIQPGLLIENWACYRYEFQVAFRQKDIWTRRQNPEINSLNRQRKSGLSRS